jgi:hypothetical protein
MGFTTVPSPPRIAEKIGLVWSYGKLLQIISVRLLRFECWLLGWFYEWLQNSTK